MRCVESSFLLSVLASQQCSPQHRNTIATFDLRLGSCLVVKRYVQSCLVTEGKAAGPRLYRLQPPTCNHLRTTCIPEDSSCSKAPSHARVSSKLAMKSVTMKTATCIAAMLALVLVPWSAPVVQVAATPTVVDSAIYQNVNLTAFGFPEHRIPFISANIGAMPYGTLLRCAHVSLQASSRAPWCTCYIAGCFVGLRLHMIFSSVDELAIWSPEQSELRFVEQKSMWSRCRGMFKEEL